MSGATCVIVGLDGFDPDVLVNLQAFYAGCGFHVSVSRTVRDAELLVIQRGAYQPGQVFEVRASECHIYDYVFNGVSDLHAAFPNVRRVIVIAPSGRASGATRPPRLVHGFHPVVPQLWASRAPGGHRPFRVVHIGHRKDPPSDPWQSEVQALAADGPCHFWGRGWLALGPSPAAEGRLHGPTSLHETQGIYRRAHCALGVMHGFQRGNTISGRMWQAPLNGCHLLTEAMLPNVDLPGVHVVDDFRSAVDDPQRGARPEELVEAASDYWGAATRQLALKLGYLYRPLSRAGLGALYGRYVYFRHVKLVAERIQQRRRGQPT